MGDWDAVRVVRFDHEALWDPWSRIDALIEEAVGDMPIDGTATIAVKLKVTRRADGGSVVSGFATAKWQRAKEDE